MVLFLLQKQKKRALLLKQKINGVENKKFCGFLQRSGTLIATEFGYKPIDTVSCTDKLLTTTGFQKIKKIYHTAFF